MNGVLKLLNILSQPHLISEFRNVRSSKYTFFINIILIIIYLDQRIAIDVLRVAAKACVVKREFDKARILILKAVKMAAYVLIDISFVNICSIHIFVSYSNHFGESHQKYADTLLDYGFFLLNVDDIVRSVHAYTVTII